MMMAYEGDVRIAGPGASLRECNSAIRRARRDAGRMAKQRQYLVVPESDQDRDALQEEAEAATQ
jgi:hypothetical protein